MSNTKNPHSESGILETMTIADVRAFRPEVVVIPFGSTEPHGPHLPYGTDTIIVGGVTEEAVRRANAGGARVLRLPPLPIGNNVNFKVFPFACRMRVETLMAVLMDLVSFVREDGVRKVVIVNGHGGNDHTLKAGLRQMFDHFQQDVFVCSCSTANFAGQVYDEYFKDGSLHAGDYETSMVQHLAPDLVVDSARKHAEMKLPLLSALAKRRVEWIKPWHQFMPESYGGNPEQATAEKGREFLEICANGLAEFLIDLSREPWHPQFPYPAEAGSQRDF